MFTTSGYSFGFISNRGNNIGHIFHNQGHFLNGPVCLQVGILLGSFPTEEIILATSFTTKVIF